MTTLDTFNAFFDDTMKQEMSVHAFGMYAKGCITLLELEYQQLKEESETTNGDLTALIHRAFLIMNGNKFFECNEGGEWYSSLHREMTKVITNRKFTDRYTMQNTVIEQLKKRITELEQPSTCKSCKYLNDNVCNHPGIPEFYTPQYINYSGCGLLHDLKDVPNDTL